MFAAAGVSILALTHAATPGTMTLTPASANASVGATVTVTITEDSLTTPVNAVQADLTYDKTKLEYVSSDGSTSAFAVEAQKTGGNGTVLNARGSIDSLIGARIVVTVTFKAIGTGSTAISFANSSVLATAADQTNILSATTGATVNITDTTVPTAPTGVTAPAADVTSIGLSWAPATDNVGVTGYNIYRNGVKVASTTNTSYTNTGLKPGTTYSYTIQAYDAAGNLSAQSSPALSVATDPDTSPPTKPSGLSAASVNTSSFTLNWVASTDNVGVTGYNIYRNGVKLADTKSTATSYAATGLNSGTTYSYAVEAYDASGNVSGTSPALSVTTTADTAAPSKPATPIISSQTNISATLNWVASTDNVGVTGYNIYRDGSKLTSTNSTSTSYADLNLKPGTTYSYAIQAYDAAGNLSVQSSVISVTLSIKLGDINADDKVDIKDLSILSANFGKSGATRSMGDLKVDGLVDVYDLSILCVNWGK